MNTGIFAGSFFCDYYPIAVPELDTSAWTAWQYHSPEEDGGVVMAFRRDERRYKNDCRNGSENVCTGCHHRSNKTGNSVR